NGKKGDGAGLRGHYRKANGAPTEGAIALEVGAEVATAARLPHAVGGDAEHRTDQDDVIQRRHRRDQVIAVRPATQSTKEMTTNIYTPRQVWNRGTPVAASSGSLFDSLGGIAE